MAVSSLSLAEEASKGVSRVIWGIRWHSKNRSDGVSEHLMYKGCLPLLFTTRREARAYIQKWYGYIKERDDLRREPHGWRLPTAVKVSITEEVE